MQEIKLGLIGTSGRGELAQLAQPYGARVVAGADVHQDALDEFHRVYGTATLATMDYHELLANPKIEAVMITSPDYCHEEQAVAALEAGKIVYLEKPLALTIEGADRLLATVRQRRGRLYLGHNLRFFPAMWTLKEIVASGAIGEVQAIWCRHFVSIGVDAYFKDWHAERKNTTGLLLQKGCHDIDIIHWLAQSFSRRVVGMGKLSVFNQCRRRVAGERVKVRFDLGHWPPESNQDLAPLIDVEDHSMVIMELSNGVQASYMQCHYTPDYFRNFTVIGTRGRAENLGDSGPCQVQLFNNRSDTYAKPDRVHYLAGQEGGHGGADEEIMKNFIAWIRGTEKARVSPVDARQAVACGYLATQSLRNGNCCYEIPPLADDIATYFSAHG